ncbi:MAG: hypothetical protein U0736_18180 [Gemmataceae bacterium]
MEWYWIALLTVVVLVTIKLGVLFVLGGMSFARFGPALQAYLKVLTDAGRRTRSMPSSASRRT